ncbi:MAG: HAMP domain-containing histidine kinase [Phycisphaerae bacterium]|nr:HAMP domain-containing histidine kinase [Phycisphaerae bacterium]
MRRPWHTWLIFAWCMALVLGTMTWISVVVLGIEAERVEARRQALLEENVRLALWRMDSAVAPLIAEETVRPYFDYVSFYPAERAYTRMFTGIEPGEALAPSPLLTLDSPYVVIHFQIGPDDRLTSPRVPVGDMRDLALRGYTTEEKVQVAERLLGQVGGEVDRQRLLAVLPRTEPRPATAPVQWLAAANRPQGDSPAAQSAFEGQFRASNVAQLQQQAKQGAKRALPRQPVSNISEGLIYPLWVDSELLLARRVVVDGREYVQGCRLDWSKIESWLLEGVQDLLPGAKLVKAEARAGTAGPRMMAALPARLIPGTVPVEAGSSRSPMRLSLVIAWACVLLAAVAVGALLRGTLALSERRAAFVSAVTHELRTPLTTFRMYTEMLSEGMVPDEGKHREYLGTLQTEAERLSHLVENVLACARLERGRAAERVETVTVTQLLDRVTDRLERQALQADMRLAVEINGAMMQRSIRVDTSAVDQILFNLVDNACKYAGAASDKRVHLEVSERGGWLVLAVVDHGPGVREQDVRRIFQPFFKSASEAAESAPGVGLGLSLARRLARSAGGDLRVGRADGGGARFELWLPDATAS